MRNYKGNGIPGGIKCLSTNYVEEEGEGERAKLKVFGSAWGHKEGQNTAKTSLILNKTIFHKSIDRREWKATYFQLRRFPWHVKQNNTEILSTLSGSFQPGNFYFPRFAFTRHADKIVAFTRPKYTCPN